jgi:hypothetical protein
MLGFRQGWNEFFRLSGLRGVRWFYTVVLGQPICPIFKDQAWPLKMGPIGGPETCNTPEDGGIQTPFHVHWEDQSVSWLWK